MFYKQQRKRGKFSAHVETVSPPPSLLLAIEERKVVTFFYKGLYREVEPHACGVFENGRCVLIGYQVGGQSESNSDPLWRTFSVAKVESLSVTGHVFLENRPDYNPDDQRLRPLYARV